MSYPGPSGGSPAYDASPSPDDLFIKQDPEQQEPEQQEPEQQATQFPTDATLTQQLATQARLVANAREAEADAREAEADALDKVARREQTISRLRNEKVQLQQTNRTLQAENLGYQGQQDWMAQDAAEREAEIRRLQSALDAQNRNQRDAATQTDEMTVDPTGEVDNAANAHPQDAAIAPAATTAAPAATTAAPAPTAATPAPTAAAAAAVAPTAQFCSICLRSVQNVSPSTMRRHLAACGITAQDCVSLTSDQVKAQRRARRASKAVSAGKKRSAGEEPVSARLRKRARKE